jgi:DNA-binding LacI/PurR family transcriptional regulator
MQAVKYFMLSRETRWKMSSESGSSVKSNAIRKRKVRVSARDVARLASVSQSTVSRVLSNSPSDLISPETRQRVVEAARCLDYTPDPLARALRGQCSGLLGLIVRDISDPFFARVTAELITQARLQNYHIVLGHAGSNSEEALQFTDILDARHTDGVFLLGDMQGDENALQEKLRFTQALVAICRGPSPSGLFTVNTDNFAGVHALLNHLTGLGHRRIGFISGGWKGNLLERSEAFHSYIHEYNLPLRSGWMQSEPNNSQGGYLGMSRILAAGDRPSAVFAADDLMALGAIKAANTVGCKVPDEISVVGFDDIELASYICPALTTVSQPVIKIAAKAIELMVQLILDPEAAPKQRMIRLAPRLVVRQSSGPTAI